MRFDDISPFEYLFVLENRLYLIIVNKSFASGLCSFTFTFNSFKNFLHISNLVIIIIKSSFIHVLTSPDLSVLDLVLRYQCVATS